MNTPTPTPRPALKATGMRRRYAPCLETELAALTAERDQLRSDCENETKWAAHYLAQSIADKARAERAEKAEIALAEIDSIIWASLSEKEWYDEKHDIIDIIEDWKKQKQRH